jgi:hypothetical protein
VIFGAALTLALLGQSMSWIPPTCEINDDYLETVKQLLGTYLGDPRGAKYLKLEVELGRLNDDGLIYAGFKRPNATRFKLEGWLLPGEPKRAILWDGLIYPVKRVIGSADMIGTAKTARFPNYAELNRLNLWFHEELFTADTPAAAALLLLSSQTRAAEEVYVNGTSNEVLIRWLLRRNIINAYHALRNGKPDDALRWLVTAKQLREDTHSETLDLNNLQDQVLELIADLKERREHPIREVASLDPGDVNRIKTELAGVRFLYSGWGYGPLDPTLKNIVDRGGVAVPALLQLRHVDDRFTLAQYPSRNFSGPAFAPISVAARYALEQLWPEFPLLETKDDAALETLFRRHADLSTAERLTEILEDDSLSADVATQALGRLSPPYGWIRSGQQLRFRMDSARLHSRIARAASARGDGLLSELGKKEGNPLHFALRFLSNFASWDYAEAKTRIHALARFVLPMLDQDNGSLGRHWDTALDCTAIGLRNSDGEAVTWFEELTAKKNAVEHWIQIVGCAANAPGNAKVDNLLQSFFNRTNPDSQTPKAWLERLVRIDDYWWEKMMAVRAFRGWLDQCLNNTSYELAEGGSDFDYRLRSERWVSFKAPKKGPEFIRLMVADVVAQVLTNKFDTALAFDFFGSDEVKAKQRRALQDWLRRLPEGPVKEYQLGQKKPKRERARAL